MYETESLPEVFPLPRHGRIALQQDRLLLAREHFEELAEGGDLKGGCQLRFGKMVEAVFDQVYSLDLVGGTNHFPHYLWVNKTS